MNYIAIGTIFFIIGYIFRVYTEEDPCITCSYKKRCANCIYD